MAVLHRVLEKEAEGSSFVDDLTLTQDDVVLLQRAIDAFKRFVEVTDQRVNTAKCQVFGMGHDPGLRYGDDALPWTAEVKLLGVKLRFREAGVLFQTMDGPTEKLVALAHRIRYSGLGFDLRALVAGALIGGRLGYAAVALDLHRRHEGQLRTAVGRAIWQKSSKQRSPGLLFTLVCKGHVVDPAQLVHVRRLSAWWSLARTDPGLLDKLNAVWAHKANKGRQRGTGIVANLVESCRRLGIRGEGEALRLPLGGQGRYVSPNEVAKGLWGHELREKARLMVLKQVAHDRARSGDVVELARGVDRVKTTALYNKVDRWRRGLLRKILLGGVVTQNIRRHFNTGGNGLCEHCDQGVEEDLRHLWWDCPRWRHLRTHGRCEAWPRAFAAYGIVPQGSPLETGTVEAVQSQMVTIFCARYGGNVQVEG